jgi:hypothetical protein
MRVSPIAAAAGLALAMSQAPAARLYSDPARRFTFSYPADFGAASRGTNDGSHGRVSVRFESSTAEAVLITGPVTIDRQALGGLYDEMGLDILQDADRGLVAEARPPITADNFCDELRAPTHANRMRVPDRLTAAIQLVDRLGNDNPVVHACDRSGSIIQFDKEAGLGPPSPIRRHVFGAVRFLDGRFSSFQIVGIAGALVPRDRLDALAQAVRSLVIQ